MNEHKSSAGKRRYGIFRSITDRIHCFETLQAD